MKSFWIDVLLAFLIWQLSIYLYENTTPQYFLEQEIKEFNQDIENNQVISDYHISKETNPNNISNFVESISNLSRETIQIVVDMTMGIIDGFD